MVKKLAIDWDESELRLVAAQCSGSSIKVTDAVAVPISDAGVGQTLRSLIERRGLANTETLVAIGRGSAELRELQLPPVPDDELPDMVRFQAIRSFATAGDSATVDYLVTNRTETGIELIAAAVGPDSLARIRETCEGAELTTKRIALRPLATSALFLISQRETSGNDTVLVDLLADDAEIIVIRQGRVIFVRTVRMPTSGAARGRALSGELKRSLVACGSSGSLDRVILWGRQVVHASDVTMLAEASGSQVEMIDPFDLVDVDAATKSELTDHVGRLAPLVGLLVADENDGNRLIDFINPRQKVEQTESPYRKAAMIGVPVALVLLLAFGVWRQLKGLDSEIAELKTQNANMQPDVDRAIEAMARTEQVDVFLDGDINWLNEIRRLANTMPPADKLIVRNISGEINRSLGAGSRRGGGTLKVEGAATDPQVIVEFEDAVRDDNHRVTGAGASDEKTKDSYRWAFSESIAISPESIRNQRYEKMAEQASPSEPSAEDLPPDADGSEDSDIKNQDQQEENQGPQQALDADSDGPAGNETAESRAKSTEVKLATTSSEVAS